MKTGEILRFFRKNNKQKQKEVLPFEMSLSVYSRIESDKQSINFEDLQQTLESLCITPEEFIAFSDADCKQRKFIELFNYCGSHLENQTKKKQLLSYYNLYMSDNNLPLTEYSNLIAIKRFFGVHWDEVEQLKKDEVQNIVNYISNRLFLTYYDYNILLNISSLLSVEQSNAVIHKALPIKKENKRSRKTKVFAYNIARNLITAMLYEGEFQSARKYIELAKMQDVELANYNYRMHIQYLQNLLDYLETGNAKYHEKIMHYIHTLEDIGDHITVNDINKEVRSLTHQKGNGISLWNDVHPITIFKED